MILAIILNIIMYAKSWLALASHNFKWVKNQFENLVLFKLIYTTNNILQNIGAYYKSYIGPTSDKI